MQFSWEGGFCLLLELHWEGPAQLELFNADVHIPISRRLKTVGRVNFTKRKTNCLRPFYSLNFSSLNTHYGA